jgi:hypothetical protein
MRRSTSDPCVWPEAMLEGAGYVKDISVSQGISRSSALFRGGWTKRNGMVVTRGFKVQVNLQCGPQKARSMRASNPEPASLIGASHTVLRGMPPDVGETCRRRENRDPF